MHIMEGFLPISWSIFWWVIALFFMILSTRSIKKLTDDNPRTKLLLGLATAFIFVLSSLKLPSLTGSSSHPTGVALGAILFGPTPMTILGSLVLVLQALILAHGGITTLGANAFSMAIAGPFISYGVYRLARKLIQSREIAIFMATFLGDLMVYVVTSGELALAFPSETSGYMGSFIKFLSIFAFTQVPIAIIEGLLTVFVMNLLFQYSTADLKGIRFLEDDIIINEKSSFRLSTKSIVILFFVGLIIALPFLFGDFQQLIGTDDQAVSLITQVATGYEPWFQFIWKPANKNIETMIFYSIAFMGLTYIIYFFTMAKRMKKEKKQNDINR